MAKGIPDAEKRRLIVDRSRALFFERGISALSMDDIASLQGISKKTLYKFFPNKDALLFAVVEERVTLIAAETARLAADAGLPWLDRIGGIFKIVATQIGGISQTAIQDIYYNRPELWERIDQFRRDHVFSIMTRLLEEGRKKGFIRGDIDGELVPLLFTSAISAVMAPAQFVKMPFPPAKLFDAFIRILFGGILTDSTRRRFFTQEGKV